MSEVSFDVVIRQGDQEWRITADDESSLLESMHRHQLPVRKACRNGACGVCRCTLVQGDIRYGSRFPHGLWQKDIDAGVILPCIARPASDLLLTDLTLQTQPR